MKEVLNAAYQPTTVGTNFKVPGFAHKEMLNRGMPHKIKYYTDFGITGNSLDVSNEQRWIPDPRVVVGWDAAETYALTYVNVDYRCPQTLDGSQAYLATSASAAKKLRRGGESGIFINNKSTDVVGGLELYLNITAPSANPSSLYIVLEAWNNNVSNGATQYQFSAGGVSYPLYRAASLVIQNAVLQTNLPVGGLYPDANGGTSLAGVWYDSQYQPISNPVKSLSFFTSGVTVWKLFVYNKDAVLYSGIIDYYNITLAQPYVDGTLVDWKIRYYFNTNKDLGYGLNRCKSERLVYLGSDWTKVVPFGNSRICNIEFFAKNSGSSGYSEFKIIKVSGGVQSVVNTYRTDRLTSGGNFTVIPQQDGTSVNLLQGDVLAVEFTTLAPGVAEPGVSMVVWAVE